MGVSGCGGLFGRQPASWLVVCVGCCWVLLGVVGVVVLVLVVVAVVVGGDCEGRVTRTVGVLCWKWLWEASLLFVCLFVCLFVRSFVRLFALFRCCLLGVCLVVRLFTVWAVLVGGFERPLRSLVAAPMADTCSLYYPFPVTSLRTSRTHKQRTRGSPLLSPTETDGLA